MSKLKYLSEQGLSELRDSFEQNHEIYKIGDSPLVADRYRGLIRESALDVILPELQDSIDRDGENAVLLYEAMKALEPAPAADSRLWTCLAHDKYWAYTQKRWVNPASTKDSLRGQFFIDGSGLGALAGHSIARLWWGGYLTYSVDSEMTRFLFSNQTLFQGIAERDLGKNRAIVRPILDGLRTFAGTNPSVSMEVLAKSVLKAVNQIGGVRLLDVLSSQEIMAIVSQTCSKVTHCQ